jgi:hypothetical protein
LNYGPLAGRTTAVLEVSPIPPSEGTFVGGPKCSFRCKHRKEHRKRGPDRHDSRLGARVPGRREPLEIAGARKCLGNLKRGLAAGHARRVALAERAG